VSDAEISDVDPLPVDQTTGPVRLQIPAIELDVPVIAMGWRVGMVDGKRTTIWDVPDQEAGWHINSAGAGGAGNTIISGSQVGGTAVFSPLALGAVAVGQDVFLTDGDGIVFAYRIRQVTGPIPVTGATAEEQAAAAAFFAPSDTAQLTLVTGWPEFTTTHRVFAVADFVGVAR
jgi:sortase (surface protein transpeptidase)